MRSSAVALRAAALAFALGANACAATVSDDATASVPVTGDPLRAAAATIAGIARELDDANTDGFIASSLSAGEPVSVSAACLRPDNSLGTRTTPLTNPAFAAAAIEQRERLIRVLEDYEALRVAVASEDTDGELLAIAGEYRAALALLKASAAIHGPGDLFIDEPAASLDPAGTAASVQTLTKELNASTDRAALTRLTASQHASITKLIVIAFDDTAANRTQAEAATLNVAGLWQRYAGSVPATKLAPTSGKIGAIARSRALPACGEPFSAAASANPPPSDGSASAAPMAPSIGAKFDAATGQHGTLVALNGPLGAFFGAMATVNETPGDDAAALQAAFDRFTAAARTFAETGAPLR